jgi:hypothetical protein
MSDDSFGSERQDEADRPIVMTTAARPLNSMEHELTNRMTEELPSTVMPFFDGDDGTLENQAEFVRAYGREFTISEAMLIGGLEEESVVERYRRQICAARDLGREGTFADYLVACEVLGLDPILEDKK